MGTGIPEATVIPDISGSKATISTAQTNRHCYDERAKTTYLPGKPADETDAEARLLGYTSPVIKRLVLILLLVVAPLQAAWGVAGGYCPHDERSADTQHFGHHVHQHQAADQNDVGDPTATGSDTDCFSCHLGCVGVAVSPAPVLLSTPASSAVAPPARFPLSIFLQGPERPNWAPAV
ncbi:DUF2946 family protein [Accumulibacter sp.]|uniref:DUF2946 family protein n=1 Tax=Accumulibacter sp. TaxID=2053492 RepID=UPI00345A8A7F